MWVFLSIVCLGFFGFLAILLGWRSSRNERQARLYQFPQRGPATFQGPAAKGFHQPSS